MFLSLLSSPQVTNLVLAAGLSGLWDSIRQNWLGPLFLAAVAVFSIIFLKNRQWTALISFVGIAIVVAVLIFAGSSIFGDGSGTKGLGKAAENVGSKLGQENQSGY